MVSNKDLDRREFLCLSALAAAAIVLPDSLHATPSSESGLVTLQVIGDPQQGFGVTILYRGQAIARHHQGGEFSAVFQNSERSLEDRTDNWKATAWTGNPTPETLSSRICVPPSRSKYAIKFCPRRWSRRRSNCVRQICSRSITSLRIALSRRQRRRSSGASIMPTVKAARCMNTFLPQGFARKKD